MNKLHKKAITALATGALLFNSALPAFADVTIEMSGNGASSDNDATVNVGQTTVVTQDNDADIHNKVFANADTGDNDADKNTGGDVSVDTGDATVEVRVENDVNTNSAEVDCCAAGDTEVLIEGNGYDSENTVGLGMSNNTVVTQNNEAQINNLVDANADTGDNGADKNTGGDVTVETGDATVLVGIKNKANSNSAKVGGNGGGMTLSARILGNGAMSDNDITLGMGRSINLVQSNDADLHSVVFANADTGDNDADENTGGDVSVDTGDAGVGVGIDNMANFNWADVDCGCLFDVLAKIAGNGYDSDNTIWARLYDTLVAVQSNDWDSDGICISDCDGPKDDLVSANADTGDNDADKNTGDPDGDPSVETGDALVGVELENSGNANIFGSVPEWELPDFWEGFSINLSLDLSALLALLG